MDNVIKSMKISAFFVIISAMALLASNRAPWAIGLIVGAVWSMANIIFTINILKISVLKKEPAKLSALILLKFPVLYLIGFLILNSRAFPVESLLTGLTVVIITLGIFKLWPRLA